METRKFLTERLHMRFKRIYSPVFELAFRCDPYYDALRDVHEQTDDDDLLSQCREAIQLLCRSRPNDVASTTALYGKYVAMASGGTSVFDTL
ncbi:hypothetical protein SPRG_12766 [Saprolegnia parasitica CBS 223.65]|uniref:Uncharacterized protein n=1 Tax=Saprolegnia parasitica (strain CBS 223.65) TaxID=695850 RepID=A0A067BW16_SAPPC|nr:hypothetical protein SPRG_12766 [Saprolegnia parasitica CBS 223.65]KDO22483.1 hypothetical protein SPRG_12766 [Saprolegnia parasitica CBS 223.65]|eukprot:XP_012206869.1 hypothetical protein SPRG_12766 [Saprolegnia parasitica CBS 223.65]